jgi:hypothetical protein
VKLEQVNFCHLYQGLSYEEYTSTSTNISALRSGHLKHLKKSPAHLKAALEAPREETEALRQGKLVHSFLENPEKFMDTYVMEPEFTGKTKDGKDSSRSAEARQAKVDWYASLGPKSIVVKKDDITMIKGISKTIREQSRLRELLKEGMSETSLWVKDPETGVNLTCRPDFITKHGHVVDIKTTRDASIPFFLNQIFSDKFSSPFYVLQAAHYSHCIKSAKVGNGESFIFVAIEKEAPWGVRMFPLDSGQLDVGEQVRARLTKLYAECLSKDVWPCYPDEFVHTEIPSWVGWEGEI